MIRKSNHIIAGNIRVAFILLLLNFLTVNISAQPQHRTVETRLKEYFRTYQSPEVEIGTCKLVRFQLNAKKRTLAIFANANFGHQPFRPQTTEKIYADLRKRLPGPVNYYNITIFVGDKSIDDLIPNIYRKTKDNTRLWGKNTHRGHAWVSNLSRPYSISEGLQGRHLAITPSHGKYYKNDEATQAAFTEDGWMRTGDLGYIDKKKNIFIRGRIKSMILGASGQNIYPEEIEDKLNSQLGVGESVVVEREGKLIGLVFPDEESTKSMSIDEIKKLMKENLAKLNKLIPGYSQVSDIEIKDKPFEKTPKKSIKRFLYK